MDYDINALIKGRKYPTIITNLFGEMIRKTNHKILKHPYLRKGSDLSFIVFENHFYDFDRIPSGVKTTAILKLDEEYNISVERQGFIVILSVIDKVSYDLNRLPVFDDNGALLVRQSSLKYPEPYIPVYFDSFCPANGFSVISYLAKSMFDGGNLSFISHYEDTNFVSYGDERRFYEVVSSMMAIAVECDIGDKVFAGAMPDTEGYRIVVTAKVYEGNDTENSDLPSEAEEELLTIKQTAKENYWLFSAHISEDGMMELSLDLAMHGYPRLLLVTKDHHRNLPAIPTARFGRVRHKGMPY